MWPQSTTSRLLTIAARRSGSSSTTCRSASISQGVFDHPDRAGHDLRPGRDDRPGLLALEHRRGDLAGVGQVADPRLLHLDARLPHPLLELMLELASHLVDVAAQRMRIGFGAS